MRAARSSSSLNENVEDRTPTSGPLHPVSESSQNSYNFAQEFGKSEQEMRNPRHHQNKMESFLEPSTAVARLPSPRLRATPGTPAEGFGSFSQLLLLSSTDGTSGPRACWAQEAGEDRAAHCTTAVRDKWDGSRMELCTF